MAMYDILVFLTCAKAFSSVRSTLVLVDRATSKFSTAELRMLSYWIAVVVSDYTLMCASNSGLQLTIFWLISRSISTGSRLMKLPSTLLFTAGLMPLINIQV